MRPSLVYLLLALCTVLAFLARGYCLGKEDQNLYLPFVLHWNDPSLFPEDHLLQLGFARESLAWTGIALGANWVPLPLILLSLWLSFAYAGLLLAYRTAEAWWRSAEAGWIAVLLWIPSYVVPGVANTTFDDYMTTRIVGTTCGLLAIYGLVAGRPMLMASGLLLGALGHIISVLPVMAGVAAVYLWGRRWKDLLLAAGSVGAGAAVLMGYASLYGSVHGLFQWYTPEWLEVVQHVDHELFPQLWIPGSWEQVLLYLALFALLASQIPAKETEQGRAAVLLVLGILCAALLGTLSVWANFAFLVQCCLWRGQLFILFIIAVLLAGLAERAMRDARGLVPFIVLLALLLWIRDDWILRVMACALLAGVLHREELLRLFPWAGLKRRGWHRALLILAGAVLILLFGDFFLAWNVRSWLPPGGVTAAVLLPAAALALLTWRAQRRGKDALGTWIPAAFLTALLLAPSEMMAVWLGSHRSVRHLYGTATMTRILQHSREVRNAEEIREAARLAGRSVPNDSIVLVPPDWMTFRLQSLRTPFITYKDGAPSEFSRAYAALWKERMDEIHALRTDGETWSRTPDLNLTREELLELARRYRDIKLDFVITKQALDLPMVSRSGPFILYRLAEQ